ncbi:MAG: glycosyltransferase, partial [Gammaproteobacteria bacterium]|nr:glycosyltransferase [Gammaproteobacteria bacterium]
MTPEKGDELRVSVVTVVKDAVNTIEDTLQSVASQSYPLIEHIVVDGGSVDGTLDIVHAYQSVISKVISAPDNGIYDAMNKGIALARGDVVGMLNGDDVFAHDRVIARIADVFHDPATQACYADLVYMDAALQRVVRYWQSAPYRPGAFHAGWIPAHPTFYVRREVYAQHGVFDLEYRLQADFEMALRLLAIHAVHSVYVPQIWVKMRIGGATNRSLKNIVRGSLESYWACRRHGLDVS